MATATKSSVKVRISLPVGLNLKGTETRAYLQQIVGPNSHKLETKSIGGRVNVYDWIIRNAGKGTETVKAPDGQTVTLPAANFTKIGRTVADEHGLYRIKYEVGDGIYRAVRVDIDSQNDAGRFPNYPETVFLRVNGGKVETLDANAARAAVGLPPVAETKSKVQRVADNDDDISV